MMSKVLSNLSFSVRKLIKYNIYKCKTLCKWKMGSYSFFPLASAISSRLHFNNSLEFGRRDNESIFCVAGSVEQSKNRIIWVDLEMTGLNVIEDKILEVASIITDDNLNIVSDEFQMVIHQPESVLDFMIPWCQEQHVKTGLVEESRKSIFNEEMAEEELLTFLKRYVPYNTCPLAGNCLYMDRAFLKRHMPRVYEYLGNEIIDVASINELAKRWNRKIEKKKQRKTGDHRALGDIKDSIEELLYYKTHIFL